MLDRVIALTVLCGLLIMCSLFISIAVEYSLIRQERDTEYKRDAFAAAAMQTLIETNELRVTYDTVDIEAMALFSYQIADEMINARKVRNVMESIIYNLGVR